MARVQPYIEFGATELPVTGLPGCLPARHFNIVTVALANKTARIAWAVMANGSEYRAAA